MEKEGNHRKYGFLNIRSRPKETLHYLCLFYTECTECKGCHNLIGF